MLECDETLLGGMGWPASSNPRCSSRGNNRLTKLTIRGATNGVLRDLVGKECAADRGGPCPERKGAVCCAFLWVLLLGFGFS